MNLHDPATVSESDPDRTEKGNKVDNDKVGSEKLDLIGEIAAKIADSLTFILSVSNIKAICSSHYFHKHLIVLYIFKRRFSPLTAFFLKNNQF